MHNMQVKSNQPTKCMQTACCAACDHDGMGRSNAVEWSRRVSRWKDSGQTAREFSRREGICHRQLYAWKWRLKQPKWSRLATISREASAGFVPVVVEDGNALRSEEARAPLEVAMGNGIVVRVVGGHDASVLRQVLEVCAQC